MKHVLKYIKTFETSLVMFFFTFSFLMFLQVINNTDTYMCSIYGIYKYIPQKIHNLKKLLLYTNNDNNIQVHILL